MRGIGIALFEQVSGERKRGYRDGNGERYVFANPRFAVLRNGVGHHRASDFRLVDFLYGRERSAVELNEFREEFGHGSK